MASNVSGPFGRTGSVQRNNCGLCHDCCGRAWADFPDKIYATIKDKTGLYGDPVEGVMTLHKSISHGTECINCDSDGGTITYRSSVAKTIYSDNYPGESDESCCVYITLAGACAAATETEEATCTWQLVANWVGGDPLEVAADVTNVAGNPNCPDYCISSCNDLEVSVTYGGIYEVPSCILGASSGIGGATVEISETRPAGIDAVDCPYSCCPSQPEVLYATVTSSCAELNGMVINLTNVGGQIWESVVDVLNGCCPTSCDNLSAVFVGGIIRYSPFDPNPDHRPGKCQISFSLGKDFNNTCFNQTKWVDPGCFPQTFSDVWAAGGGCGCCTGGASISVEITG